MQVDPSAKSRIDAIEQNARSRFELAHTSDIAKNASYFQRFTGVSKAPIFISNSNDIGTRRVRANHYDALVDFFSEQEALKKAGAPM